MIKRIIACLDVLDGQTVKGVNFKNLRQMGDPVRMAKDYEKQGADELVFLDVGSTANHTDLMLKTIEKTAEEVFIPLCVGGGIKTIQNIKDLLSAGADKISLNTAAVNNPDILKNIADIFGAQITVLSLDILQTDGFYEITTHGGRLRTGIDAIEFAYQNSPYVGEILINSINCDGCQKGFDIELLQQFKFIGTNIIASGGAGTVRHFCDAAPYADALLAASVFHMKKIDIAALKKEMQSLNIKVRV